MLTYSIPLPPSVDGQPAAAEWAAHAFRQRRIRRLDVFQRILKAQLLPLIPPHLVEAQNLHALDRLQPSTEIGHFFHVVIAVGETRHEHEAYPHQASQR